MEEIKPSAGPLGPLVPLAKAELARLVPGELSAQAREAAAALALEAQAHNTIRSYRAAMEYWEAWHLVRFGERLPCPTAAATVVEFLTDHCLRRRSDASEVLEHGLPLAADKVLVAAGVKKKLGPLALSTVQHRLAVLASAHHNAEADARRASGPGADLPNPCTAREVRELLADIKRAYAKRGTTSRKKPALTADLVAQLLATCEDTVLGRRDRALLSVAFGSGGRRRSELADADLANLDETEGGYIYRLVHSKTNQAGEDRPEDSKPILGSAAAALRDWIQDLAAQGFDTTSGPLFRRVRRGDHIGESLTTSAIWGIVKGRCARAGLGAGFSPHSLRSGFLTEAGRRGAPLPEAMAMSGHASVKTALGYYRVGELQHSRAAHLLDDTEK